ncbi:MAG: methionyl-tRNA formyltransferase, partial [Phycisphaerae bacterium]
MRILFLGSGEFGVPTLEALCDDRHVICAVVTRPDRPAGRGRQPAPTPVKQLALRRGLPLMQP